MRILALISSLVILCSHFSLAHEGHDHRPSIPIPSEDDICSEKNLDVCAHVHFSTEVISTKASEFILHIEDESGNKPTNMKIVVVMILDNGEVQTSLPVEIIPMNGGKFKIKNAWFPAKGTWTIKTSFNIGAESYEIGIPVSVAK